MAKFGQQNRRGAMKGIHPRHHLNSEPLPVGRPDRKLSFGAHPRPKKRRY